MCFVLFADDEPFADAQFGHVQNSGRQALYYLCLLLCGNEAKLDLKNTHNVCLSHTFLFNLKWIVAKYFYCSMEQLYNVLL